MLVHFKELALQMINVRRKKADLIAAKIAKNLTRIERVNIENDPGSESRITQPLWIWTRWVSLPPIRTVQVPEYGFIKAPEESVYQTAARSL